MNYNTRLIADHMVPALLFLLDQIKRTELGNPSNVTKSIIEEKLSDLIDNESSFEAVTLKRAYDNLYFYDTGYRPEIGKLDPLVRFYDDNLKTNFLEFGDKYKEAIREYMISARHYRIKKENPAPFHNPDQSDEEFSELGNYYQNIIDSGTSNSSLETDHNFWMIKESAENSRPTLALVNDTDRQDSYWRNKAFSIQLLLESPIEILRTSDRFQLQVSTKNELYGIYNNKGKSFIAKTFKRSSNDKVAIEKLNDGLNRFLYQKQNDTFPLRHHPYRWASGGAVPIANYKGKDWVVLFFRDIAPKGWNIANGASENEDERKQLNRLIYREFAEEINIFSSNPLDEKAMVQKRFFDPRMIQSEVFLSPSFYKKQHELRMRQDDFRVRFDSDLKYTTRISHIQTPFDLTVDSEHFTGDILFNINPFEYGIEILRILRFDLKDGDYILDGEMHESESFLMRRPVMLLSVDFLKHKFEKNQTLGQVIGQSDAQESITLNEIPDDQFRIFGADIELKKRRFNDPENFNELEKRFYSDWLDQFGDAFKTVSFNNDESRKTISGVDNPLTWLCPATWKSLEMIFKNNLL